MSLLLGSAPCVLPDGTLYRAGRDAGAPEARARLLPGHSLGPGGPGPSGDGHDLSTVVAGGPAWGPVDSCVP